MMYEKPTVRFLLDMRISAIVFTVNGWEPDQDGHTMIRFLKFNFFSSKLLFNLQKFRFTLVVNDDYRLCHSPGIIIDIESTSWSVH